MRRNKIASVCSRLGQRARSISRSRLIGARVGPETRSYAYIWLSRCDSACGTYVRSFSKGKSHYA